MIKYFWKDMNLTAGIQSLELIEKRIPARYSRKIRIASTKKETARHSIYSCHRTKNQLSLIIYKRYKRCDFGNFYPFKH
jgi:hypothetical protein